MTRVLVAVAPAAMAGVYFFGWRCLLLLAVANAAAFAAEFAFARAWQRPVTAAVFVTATLFTLSLPPTLPAWMAILGVVFAVVFGKMVFGGFGRNVFNPALVGRAFLYVNFPVAMNAAWAAPIGGPAGGLLRYTPDAITAATPLRDAAVGQNSPIFSFLIGNIPGCIGETSALLLIGGGLWLLWTRTANYRQVLSCFLTALAVHSLLYFAGAPRAADPFRALAGGSFLFGLFFFVTEPVSGPQTNTARWIYGALIGVLIPLIRTFSVWPAGTMFSILIANTFAPILDVAVRSFQHRHARQTAP